MKSRYRVVYTDGGVRVPVRETWGQVSIAEHAAREQAENSGESAEWKIVRVADGAVVSEGAYDAGPVPECADDDWDESLADA